jgi:hypothetical protein
MSARFLIEVPHEATQAACLHAIDTLLNTGSHFFTHADWGCKDGVHNAWIIVELETKDEARAIVPPALRAHARVTQLNGFSKVELEDMMRQHKR